jgi:peptidyl-tRNA hydrolase
VGSLPTLSTKQGDIMKVKQYCIFAQEAIDKMKGVRGKMCAQAGHAFVHCGWQAAKEFPEQLEAYINGAHAYKIVLIVDTVEQLCELRDAYQNKCATRLITDKGFTVFDEPTTTCLGIGPIPEELIGDDITALKLFK